MSLGGLPAAAFSSSAGLWPGYGRAMGAFAAMGAEERLPGSFHTHSFESFENFPWPGEVFTFRADLGICLLAEELPTG